MDKEQVIALRMERQGLSRPVADEEFPSLFRRLQPVAPAYYSMPGSPPRLRSRSMGDDAALASGLRARREVVKARFRGGSIGYVLSRDLETYGAAFRRPLNRLGEVEQTLLDTMRSTGPLSPRHLREETGLLNKQIMPALHRLQRAFLVFEDQEDERWDRPWCLFCSEWPRLDIDARPWAAAAAEVVERFLEGHVFAASSQVRAWSGFGVTALRQLLDDMAAAGTIAAHSVRGLGEGWVRPADADVAPASSAPSGVWVLHRADPLVLPLADELRERYRGREVLQYLLVDGEVLGALCGHWRIRAHDVEDVVVDLAPAEAVQRQDEILAAARQHYPAPESQVLRYMGQRL